MWSYTKQDELRASDAGHVERARDAAQPGSQGDERGDMVETLRQEAGPAAAIVSPPQPAPINALADWHRRPDQAKLRVVAAQVLSREAVKHVLAHQYGFAGLTGGGHCKVQDGEEFSETPAFAFVGEARLASQQSAMAWHDEGREQRLEAAVGPHTDRGDADDLAGPGQAREAAHR